MTKTLSKKELEERLSALENGRTDFVQRTQMQANMQIAQYDGRILELRELLTPEEGEKDTGNKT